MRRCSIDAIFLGKFLALLGELLHEELGLSEEKADRFAKRVGKAFAECEADRIVCELNPRRTRKL